MSTATVPRQLEQEPRVLLNGISWETYEKLVSDVDPSPSLRLTYDRGRLELMTISQLHDFYKWLIGRLVEMMCWELKIEIRGGGSFTHKRKDLLRGLEPDECYWVQNAPAVRGPREVDLTREPPPDLHIEVDITASRLDRLDICAALGIPEVWRYDGQSLRVYLLQPDGNDALSENSAAFPFLPIDEFARFLQPEEGTSDLVHMQSFVDWLHEQGLGNSRAWTLYGASETTVRPSTHA